MSLADLLKPASVANLLKPADKAAAAIAKLQAELDEAQVKLEAIHTEWSEALLADEEGSGDSSASDRLNKQWTAAKREVQKKSAALTAATARHQVAVSDARKQEATEAWNRVESISKARTLQASRLAKSAEVFAADYQALLQLNRELFDVLPAKPDQTAAFLCVVQTEIATRQHLCTHGVDWAFGAVWGIPSLPKFLPQFEDAATVISSWRDKALGGRDLQ